MAELKKNKNYSTGNYAALVEEKDQEYKAELKNFLRKVKNHIEENSSGSSPGNGKLIEDVRRKLKSVEEVNESQNELKIQRVFSREADAVPRRFSQLSLKFAVAFRLTLAAINH